MKKAAIMSLLIRRHLLPAASLASIVFASGTAVLIAQTPAQPMPTYEVSTIKPPRPEEFARGIGWKGRRFNANYSTISQVMQFAYNLQAKQILNAPAWFDTQTYDIEVVADGGEPSTPQWRAILQQMLADRLKLRYHHEQRELPAYVLTVAKGGLKLGPPQPQPDMQNGVRIMRGPHQWMRAVGVHATMHEFAAELQRVEMDRPVVDLTGVTGAFDFTLTATSTKSFFPGEEPEQNVDAPPTLFTALKEQLGLKLEPGSVPVDCFVLNQIERPTAN